MQRIKFCFVIRLWGWICHHSFEWWIPKVLWHDCFLLYSQRLTLTLDNAENGKQKSHVAEMRERIIKRAALEFRDGMYGILLTKCNESPSSKLRHTEQWLYIWCCKWRLIFIPLWSSFPKAKTRIETFISMSKQSWVTTIDLFATASNGSMA